MLALVLPKFADLSPQLGAELLRRLNADGFNLVNGEIIPADGYAYDDPSES